jgi:esterase/lipase
MKKRYGFICLIILLLLIGILGPRVNTMISLDTISLPSDLDLYLIASESEFDDITEGTEKKIVWAKEANQKTSISVVSFHGFSATRQELSPLADIVAKSLNANLFYTRLAGHGRGSAGMIQGSVNKWANDANEAIEIGNRIGDKVILIGTSTGSTLATWLALQEKGKNISAIILMSPNYYSAESNIKLVLLPWGKKIAEAMIGKVRHWEPRNPLHEKYWANDYSTATILPMVGLVDIVDKADLNNIEVPTLMIYSSKDKVISVPSLEDTFERLGSSNKQLIEFNETEDPDFHALAGDLLSPSSTNDLASQIILFIDQVID